VRLAGRTPKRAEVVGARIDRTIRGRTEGVFGSGVIGAGVRPTDHLTGGIDSHGHASRTPKRAKVIGARIDRTIRGVQRTRLSQGNGDPVAPDFGKLHN
jgi:hypothetical protein